jgi:hypothetical protein
MLGAYILLIYNLNIVQYNVLTWDRIGSTGLVTVRVSVRAFCFELGQN